MEFRRLFWHISYYQVRQSNFIAKCDRLLLQSASGITKCDSITKWDVALLFWASIQFKFTSIKWNNVCTRLVTRLQSSTIV